MPTSSTDRNTIDVLRMARDFVDPDKSPPKHMTNREMVYEITKLIERLERRNGHR